MRGAHKLVREVWGKDVKDADLRFFVGDGDTTLGMLEFDEVILECPDAYKDLPLKTQKICRWALDKGYEHAFLCDTGSFVIPHHLANSGYEQCEYLGYWGMKQKTFSYTASDFERECPAVRINPCWPWASGGGYVISRKAMEIIANSTPFVHAEDLWIAQVLARNGVFLTDGAPESWKGKVVDWISGEQNYVPGALEKRRIWMQERYDQAKKVCQSEGCNSPSWDKYKVSELRDPDDIERILEERRNARRKK